MKRCPKCKKDFPDDANFCPADAGHLEPIDPSEAAPTHVPRIDTAGNELLAGRFAMGDIIGGARTGPVYQAGDKQGTSAMVKIVDPRVFPSALLKQRTERELKQLERLDHPGVAKILGHGRREDALWIAMELVDGVPLSQFIIQNGALPQKRAIGIVAQIGTALEAAAKLGVTHRDLSPKNIMIGQNDHVKLINFGVPLPVAEGASNSVQGVVEFVAPEQVEGRPVDQRCNIYSLGAIGYALLTGAPPFSGAASDVLAGHASGEVRALGAPEGVSPEMNAVILKSLEKTSSKRFMTLRQFLGDLEKAEGTEVAAAPSAELGKPMAKGDTNKTLMGIAPAELKALMGTASAAVGTPVPESESGAGVRDSMATTSLDHKAPDMADPAKEVDTAATAPQGSPSLSAATAPQGSPILHESAPAQAQAAPAPAQAQAAPVQAQVAPAQAQVAPAQAQAQPAAAPAGGKRKASKSKSPPAKENKSKGKFRETMWFKKGELDAAAARAAAEAKPEDRVSDKADQMEMDERYTDDGSITQQDQQRLSLRTGSTMMHEAVNPRAARGPGVSEDYLMSEMTAGRNKILAAIGVGVVVIAIIVAIAVS
jgi:hypothetical protein